MFKATAKNHVGSQTPDTDGDETPHLQLNTEFFKQKAKKDAARERCLMVQEGTGNVISIAEHKRNMLEKLNAPL